MRSRSLIISLATVLILSSFLPLWGCAAKSETPEMKTMKEAHSDHDGIPDHIEKTLKTDHKNFDSDLDGQTDYYELVIEPKLKALKKSTSIRGNFLEGVAFAEEDTKTAATQDTIETTTAIIQDIITQNSNNIDWEKIAKEPADNDGDGIHNALDPLEGKEFEGMQDQDGDKIADVYETYGYSWDHASNTPVPWGFRFVSDTSITLKSLDELDYSVRYFKSNLHNAFSDWDAYDDYREASLNNIEATVLPPTNHPCVASIPNFNVVVESAAVTVTADQITFPSHSVLKGYKKKAVFTHVEDNPFAKYFINLGAKGISKNAKAYSKGIINVDSKTIGSIMAEGIDFLIGPHYKEVGDYKTVVDVTDWLNASCDSAHKNNAASVNLRWRLINNGNDAAYDVKPTFNITLGSNLIYTYTPDTPITSIGPHSTSPPFFTSQINLSFDQLRAYMTGSLLNTRINQVSANVMTRHKIDDPPSKEDWSYFTNNMRTNCAMMTVDLGDGKLGTFKMLAVHPLGPSVTLRDTLIWAIARYNEQGKFANTAVSEYFGGSSSNIPDFNGWAFYFSGGIDPLDPLQPKNITPDTNNILDTVILPGATIYAKAPSADSPVVSWAKMSPVYNTAAEAAEITNMHQKKIDALVHDYYGVREVWFGKTPDATETEMTDDDGDGIYSLILPKEYVPTHKETIFTLREQLLTSDPNGKPVITTATVSYTAPTGHVYSKVKDSLSLPKSGKDYGDIAFFDLDNNKNYHKRGKLSATEAIDLAFGNNSDISIDLNFYKVNKDSTINKDYKKPKQYPGIGWYMTSNQSPNANICFWPDDMITYEKLSYADISTSTATTKISTEKSSSSTNKSHQQLSYTQSKYPNGSFSFMTDTGHWVKMQIIYPYDLDSNKWRVWVRAYPVDGDAIDSYDYHWRYQPESVTINYTIYDKQP